MRLDKFLADCGIGTRSEIKKIIKDGYVLVSGLGKVKPETKVNEYIDKIFVNGEQIIYKKYIYLMLNKPSGYVSAVWDARHNYVLELVPEQFLHYEPFPVGRLDIDTEGLLILTNDGDLSHRLLSPKSHVPKTYYAKISGRVTLEDCVKFKEGVKLDDGYITKPAELKIIKSGDVSEIQITITEGKFHQIKRMFEAVDKKVIYLKRISMNKLNLDSTLDLGDIRELSEEELKLLSIGRDDLIDKK